MSEIIRTTTTDAPVQGVQGHAAMGTMRGEARTAVAVAPRDQRAIVERVDKEAALAKSRWYYAWTVRSGRSREVVRGPSVWLALSLARLWGNIQVDVAVESEGPDHWVLRAVATDLESRFSVSGLFRQAKQVPGARGMGSDRGLDIAFQIGQSKVARNVVLRCLPDWLVQRALARAMAASAQAAAPGGGKVSPDMLRGLLASYRQFGVSEDMLQRRLGCPPADMTGEQFADLEAVLTALQEGQTTVQNEFAEETVPEGVAAPAAAQAVPETSASRRGDVERIGAALGLSRDDIERAAHEMGVDLDAADQVTVAAFVARLAQGGGQ